LAVRPKRQLFARLDALEFDAIHIATEGPLGWAARRYCLKNGLAFTTAFHTKFPDILKAAVGLPLAMGYAVFKHFHKPSAGVMVPTSGVKDMLAARGFGQLRGWTHGVDTELFRYHPQPALLPALAQLPRPLSLFVGRVSYEKNIEAFLKLDIPGSKVVCGVGPLATSLQARFPQAHWLGVLPRSELAKVYAACDVFVFPSHADTFGLVMLEAMASGTPVAAFPVDGPLQVLTDAANQVRGGAMHSDLRLAWDAALAIGRDQARARALDFSWAQATQSFAGFLVHSRGLPKTWVRLEAVTL
jgi:glycosyltransferase involved in cell wall biosynthesis